MIIAIITILAGVICAAIGGVAGWLLATPMERCRATRPLPREPWHAGDFVEQELTAAVKAAQRTEELTPIRAKAALRQQRRAALYCDTASLPAFRATQPLRPPARLSRF